MIREKAFGAFKRIIRKGLLNWMPTPLYLKLYYRLAIGKKLDLRNPQTFNEKLQWLKIYAQHPLYTTMVDKYDVKNLVADKIGREYIIPTLDVWDKAEDIDFDALPEKFVLKTTHDSGGIKIVNKAKGYNEEEIISFFKKRLKRSLYNLTREWPYKNVKHRIIAEDYLEDSSTSELRDYKFFCFGGVCKCMKVDFDRFIEHRANYYDLKGNLLDFGEAVYPPDKKKNIILPSNMDKMIELAEKLSKGTPFLRVDFYDVNGDIYFGELTFFPASGFGIFTDEEWNYKLGNWIELPEIIGGISPNSR